MSLWGKLAYGVLLVIGVPVAVAGFAFGCFFVTGLFTGLLLGALDALGVLKWSDTTFMYLTVPLAVVVGIALVIFRDELREW